MVIKRYSTVTVNVIPELQPVPDLSCDDNIWTVDNDICVKSKGALVGKFEKLRKVREALREQYHKEFLANLMVQSVDRKGRYKPVTHKLLGVGDLALNSLFPNQFYTLWVLSNLSNIMIWERLCQLKL